MRRMRTLKLNKNKGTHDFDSMEKIEIDLSNWQPSKKVDWKAFARYVKIKHGEISKEELLEEDVKAQQERKKQELIACRRNRQVKSCKECCRYDICFNDKSEIPTEHETSENCKHLGNMIITSIGQDFVEAYRNGWKWSKKALERKLIAKTNIYTLEELDGETFVSNLNCWCGQKYGNFETIYEKRIAPLNKKLEELWEKHDNSNDDDEKADIFNQICSVRGEIYL